MQRQPDNKNILLATILSFVILLAWAWFFEKPRIEQEQKQSQIISKNSATEKSQTAIDDETNNSK